MSDDSGDISYDILAPFIKKGLKMALLSPSFRAVGTSIVAGQKIASARRSKLKNEGLSPLPLMIISSAKNDKGAGERLSPSELASFIGEASELGISVVVFAGRGWQDSYKDAVLKIAKKYNEILFCLFVDGSFIDDATADAVKECRNIIPLIITEQNFPRPLFSGSSCGDNGGNAGADASSDDISRYEAALTKNCVSLAKRGVFFGCCMITGADSDTSPHTGSNATPQSLENCTDENFIRECIKRGAKIFFYADSSIFGDDKNTPEQTVSLGNAVSVLDKKFPAFFLYLGGQNRNALSYLHMNLFGDILSATCLSKTSSDLSTISAVNIKDASFKLKDLLKR